jgi:hypothetical protein
MSDDIKQRVNAPFAELHLCAEGWGGYVEDDDDKREQLEEALLPPGMAEWERDLAVLDAADSEECDSDFIAIGKSAIDLLAEFVRERKLIAAPSARHDRDQRVFALSGTLKNAQSAADRFLEAHPMRATSAPISYERNPRTRRNA